ncbi:MAG: translation initiation factor IF-2 [Desulfobacterales bacterium]
MAKIRVYELARNLNMKNKELLDKLENMNISVRSHMSSLDDDTVAEIKANIYAQKKTGSVEVTRVKPTVIRRRKKVENAEPVRQTEAKVLSEEGSEVLVADEKPLPEKPLDKHGTAVFEGLESDEKATAGLPEEEPEVTEEAEETLKIEETKIQEAEKPVEELREEKAEDRTEVSEKKGAIESEKQAQLTDDTKVKHPKKKKAAEFKAKIISKPEKPKPSETSEAPEEVVEKPLNQEIYPVSEAEDRSVAETKPEMPSEVEKQPEIATEAEKEEHPETDHVDHKASAAKQPDTALSEETTDKVRPKQKPPKKKKLKKDTPAKIIQLPPKTPETAPEMIKKEEEVEVTTGDDQKIPESLEPKPLVEEEAKDRKKKKRPKQIEAEEPEKKFFKKKTSFHRKEVVEGADLYETDKRTRKGKKGAKVKVAKGQKTQITTPKASKRRIKIDDAIVLSELAKRMSIKASEMIAKLMGLGVMATVNQTIDFDTAALVAAEFGYEVEKASFEEEAILKVQQDDAGKMAWRPPVVTIMGHVDHGKTSLLDVIRKTRITELEAGGITQHIGAYQVNTEKGQIVFLDTPGHEAFTAMRARGAKVTDIVILVVAADDGVMPQTIEAINHAKASKVPIVVAVNKIDKNNAEPDRVKRQLAELGLIPEEWGGDTIYVQVSAKNNTGIDELLEMILLQTEMLELRANPDKLATGNVIEAKLDSGRGPVATVLVKEGTLRAGEPIVCGVHHGKIRAMLNDRGQLVDTAGPSTPVEILGLTGVPEAGDELVALSDEKDAKQVSEHRTQKQRSVELAKTSRLSLEKLYERMKDGEVKDLNLIIKADVHGSIEALKDSLIKLSNEEVKINVGHAATGTITESDVSLAAVSNAIIIGFNVRPSPKVIEYAQEENVDMKFYNVIYNAIKDVKDAIVGMMDSTFEERTLGRAEVREIFHVPKVGTIAGCYVTDGKIERNKLVRLIRDGVIVFEGKIASLKRYKDDQKEVHSGYECGIGIENYNDIKLGDILECYYMEEIRPEIK